MKMSLVVKLNDTKDNICHRASNKWNDLESFASTCTSETFGILHQFSVKQDYVIPQFDVKTTFLHSPIEDELYLE